MLLFIERELNKVYALPFYGNTLFLDFFIILLKIL